MKIKAESKSSGAVIEADIPTNSRKEAAEQFLRDYPDSSILEIAGREYIGRCENTGHPILAGDDYQEDESGVIWIKPTETK